MLNTGFYVFMEISLITGLALIIILIAWRLLKLNLSAKWSRLVWLAACVRLLLPFSLEPQDAKPPLQISIPVAPAVFSDISLSSTANQAMDIASQASNVPTTSPVVFVILIWLIGAVAFMTLRLGGYFQFRRKINLCCKPVTDADILLLFDKLCAELQIKGKIRIINAPKEKKPAMLGFLQPILLLPQDISPADSYYILKHELVHYRNRDLWMKLLLTIVCALHWFNPTVHLMARAANESMELACDDEVLHGHTADERKSYCEVILASIQRKQNDSALTTYFYGGRKTMMIRFESIFAKTKKRGIIAFGLMAMLIISVASLVACNMVTEKTPDSPQISLTEAALNKNGVLAAATDDCYVAVMRRNGLSDDDIRRNIENGLSEVKYSRASFGNMANTIPRSENGFVLSINEIADIAGLTPGGISVEGIYYGPNDWNIMASSVRAWFGGEKNITGVFNLDEADVLRFTLSEESAKTMPAVRNFFNREIVFENNDEATAMLGGKNISELPAKITISGYNINFSVDILFDYGTGDYIRDVESEKYSQSTKLVAIVPN